MPAYVVLLVFIAESACPGAQAPIQLPEGRFGAALDLHSSSRYVAVSPGDVIAERPITLELWAQVDAFPTYNILMSQAPKSPGHWELYTELDGRIAVYIPQLDKPVVEGDFKPEVGQWHFYALRFRETSVELFVDGNRILRAQHIRRLRFTHDHILLGTVEGLSAGMQGSVDELRIARGEYPLEGYVPGGPGKANEDTLALFHFDTLEERDGQHGWLVNELAEDSDMTARAYGVGPRDRSLNLQISPARPLQGHLAMGAGNREELPLEINSEYFTLGGEPYFFIAGEVCPSRTNADDWEESLLKAKAGGLNTIQFYVVWNHYESEPGQFDFTGNRDLRRFAKLCAKHGLWLWPKIGPFINGEAKHGGLPSWLYGMPLDPRTNDAEYLFYARRLYGKLGEQLKGMMFGDGGPVIGIQLENEHEHAPVDWRVYYGYGAQPLANTVGSGGDEHMLRLKQMAIEAGFEVPVYTCTSWGDAPVPQDEIIPIFGAYAFLGKGGPTAAFMFQDIKQNANINADMTRYPLMYFETNGGMPVQAHWRAIVPPEAVEGMSLVEVGSGCNALGYYIYHGETNPVNSRGFTGLTATLPWLSHDYQAPIREFGQIADSYRYARVFHTFLKEFGPDLAPMSVVLPDERPHEPADMNMLRFSARVDAKGTGFLFVNNYQDKLEMPDRSDVQITLRLEDETIVVPEGKPASLAGDAYCVLPFNMDLAGARLKYATAQPLCLIEDEGVLHYFFFAPKGMRPEYSLDSATVQDVKTSRGEVLEREGRTLARPGSGPDAIATFTTARGTTVKLITLTREQAERTLKAELWGRERVVIASNADVLASKDGMRLYSIGVPQMEALVFPPIKKKVTADHGELELSRTGIYSMVRVKASTCEPDWSVERHGPDKAVVRVADRSFEQAHDLFLRLNYEGDTGRAFINGRLVADHYYNGLPWEIGLKRFREKLKEQERMVFRITPRTVPLNDVIFDGITFKTVSSNEDASISMSRFELVPEYAIWIR